MSLLLLLAACGPATLPALAPAPVDLTAEVAEKRVDSGATVQVVVQAWAAPGWTVPPSQPVGEGLSAALVAQEGPTLEGERERWSWTWALSGPDGSYVVGLPEVTATGPDAQTRPLAPPPVFVDIGVEGPTASTLVGFEAAPPPAPPPNGRIAAGVGGGAALLAGLGAVWWYRRGRPAPEIPADPPHVEARKAWAAAQGAGLDDHGLALALSRILRVYIEQTQGWPATARTTREIVAQLEQQRRLGTADRLRAAAVLDATDRLKFAREGGGAAFFARLGGDFEAVVQALQPHAPPAGEAP